MIKLIFVVEYSNIKRGDIINSRRGAKGSIRDRLINILYRIRYKKKKNKNYKVITKYNTFKENVKYKIIMPNYVKVEESRSLKDYNNKNDSKHKRYYKVKKVGIGEQKVKKQIVNIKKEIIVNQKKYTLTSINKKVAFKVVSNNVKKRIIIKIGLDIEGKKNNKLSQNSNTKINKLNKIQKVGFNELTNNLNVDNNKVNNNESVKQVQILRNNKDNIKLIGYVLEKQDDKEKRILYLKQIAAIDRNKKIEERIKKEVMYQQEIVNSLYDKASFFNETYYKTYKYVGYTKILSSMLRIIGGIITLPLTFFNMFGISIGATMINKGLKNLRKSLELKEFISVRYDYEDISNKLKEVKNKVEYTNLVLSDSLNEIKLIKSKLKEEYSNEKDLDEMLKKVDELEIKLVEQQSKINKINKKVEKEKELNWQKILKVGK